MQICKAMTQDEMAEKRLQADIRRTNSELLLFITLFGDAKHKQLAKTELSKRACCDEHEIDYCGADRDLSLVAHYAL